MADCCCEASSYERRLRNASKSCDFLLSKLSFIASVSLSVDSFEAAAAAASLAFSAK